MRQSTIAFREAVFASRTAEDLGCLKHLTLLPPEAWEVLSAASEQIHGQKHTSSQMRALVRALRRIRDEDLTRNKIKGLARDWIDMLEKMGWTP